MTIEAIEFFHDAIDARARDLDAYASGPLSDNYKAQRASMLKAAVELWQQVIEDGQDEKAVA